MSSNMQMLKLQGTVLFAGKDSELAYVSPGETPTVWVAEHHLPLVQLSLSAESHCRVTAVQAVSPGQVGPVLLTPISKHSHKELADCTGATSPAGMQGGMAAGRGGQPGPMHETFMNGHSARMPGCSTTHARRLTVSRTREVVTSTIWNPVSSHQPRTRRPTCQHGAGMVSPSATPSVRRLLLFPRYSRAALEVSPRTTWTSCPRMTCRRQCVLTAPSSPVT